MTPVVTGVSAVKRRPYPTPSPGRIPLTATTRLVSDITGVSGILEASGGGTMPYRSRPGPTKSYPTRESRRVAALFAALLEPGGACVITNASTDFHIGSEI